MKVTVVLNVHSRKAAALRDRISDLLSARGVEVEGVDAVDQGEAVGERIARAVSRNAECVVVGGGDGSMRTAAAVLAHRRTVLGVLPLGTGNSFAETLCIGDDFEKALDAIAAGRVAEVDLGIVNERYFANFVTIGFPAEIAQATPSLAKKVLGPLAYVAAAIVPGLRHRSFEAHIVCDGDASTLRTQQIIVASGRFYGKQPLTPDARITDSRLTLFTTTGTSPLDLARTYAAVAVGKQSELGDARVWSGRTIDVETDPPQPVNTDGEQAGTTPAHLRLDPRALRVLVPPEFFEGEK